MNPINPNTYKKATGIFVAVLITASVSGYFMGLRQTGSQISMTRPVSLVTSESEQHAAFTDETVPTAVAYAKENWLKEGPNANWQNRIGNLVQPTPDVAAFTNVTAAERALALQQRAARRAYDGAPPVVPHPIAQDSSAVCLACHGPGLAVKDKVASKISHAHYTSCTQCHVPAVGPQIPTGEIALREPIAANQFVGLSAPLKGSRAWPTAPPTTPHPTLMRSDCMSCHGPQGLFGLRTPHPSRQACVQCHAPDASLDQRVFATTLMPVIAQ